MSTKILGLLLLITSLEFVALQECQQITVCGDNTSGGRRAEKGDVGAPGKAGPIGIKGSKGDQGTVGAKGEQGSSCALDGFEDKIRREFAELKRLFIPSTCWASLEDGRQRLRSGGEVYCDGGWQVIQRRLDGSVDFDRNWRSYKDGFGNIDEEFWLGLDKIHQLTSHRGCKLRIDLWSFDGDHAFAQYSSFSIEGEDDLYRLHIQGYSGTAGDSLTSGHSLDNQQFTTKDSDNDANGSNCASATSGAYHGGWWFNNCFHADLNAEWGESSGNWKNIIWFAWKGYDTAVKETVMKLRCD